MANEQPSKPRGASVPRAMLVDLDDTLIHFPGQEESWRQVCADGAARVPGLDADELFDEVTLTRYWFWSDPERHRIGRQDTKAASIGIVQRALGKLGFDLPDVARELGLSYRKKRDGDAKLIPGAVEALLGSGTAEWALR